MWQRTLDCVGVPVRVRTSIAELEAPLADVIASFADDPRAPAIDYLLEPVRVVVDGVELVRCAEPIELIAAYERDFYRRVIVAPGGLAFHAGAVVDAHGGTYIVAGESGAGKSTLVRGLLARGLRYLSEECVALAPGRRVRGLARGLHVDDPSVLVPAGYRCAVYPLRGAPPDAFRIFHPPEAAVWRGEARAEALIAISHAPEADDVLVPLGSGAALAALWPAMFKRDAAVLSEVPAALEGVPVYRLRTSRPEVALARVLELVSTRAGERR